MDGTEKENRAGSRGQIRLTRRTSGHRLILLISQTQRTWSRGGDLHEKHGDYTRVVLIGLPMARTRAHHKTLHTWCNATYPRRTFLQSSTLRVHIHATKSCVLCAATAAVNRRVLSIRRTLVSFLRRLLRIVLAAIIRRHMDVH